MAIVKPSAWEFDTSASGGAGVAFFAAEGGKIYLKDPQKTPVSFAYGAAGAGIAFGFKLPKIGKIAIPIKGQEAGAIVAPAAFPNAGKLWVLSTCPNSDFKRENITGVCLLGEAGAGLIVGVAGAAMVFGMSPLLLGETMAAVMGGPALQPLANLLMARLIGTATGILLMGGLNVGVQGGGGAAVLLGGLW